MSINISTLLTKLLFWLAMEIILNLFGLDNLADYSEFLANQTSKNQHISVLVAPPC